MSNKYLVDKLVGIYDDLGNTMSVDKAIKGMAKEFDMTSNEKNELKKLAMEAIRKLFWHK